MAGNKNSNGVNNKYSKYDKYNKYNKYSMFTILETLYSIRKRWKMFISFVVIATFSVSMLTLIFVEPQYEARTTVFVGKDENQSEGYNRSDIEMYQQLLKTYSEIIKSKDVIKSAVDLSGIDKSLDEVSEDIDIIIIDGTQMIEIRFRSENPEECLNFINSLSTIFIEKAVGLIPNVSFQILDGAVLPQQPVVPNMRLAIGLGILLGIIMGTMFCAIKDILDNTIKTKEQIEEEFGIHVIGEIPKEKFVVHGTEENPKEKLEAHRIEEIHKANLIAHGANEIPKGKYGMHIIRKIAKKKFKRNEIREIPKGKIGINVTNETNKINGTNEISDDKIETKEIREISMEKIETKEMREVSKENFITEKAKEDNKEEEL